jgi:hypothetical protein
MFAHSKLFIVACSLVVGGAVALSPRLVEDDTPTRRVEPSRPSPPARQEALDPSGPTAAVFAARVEGFLPILERHVAAGSAKSHDVPAECAFDEAYRLADINAIGRSLLDDGRGADWTDGEARALAAPLAEALEPLRQCVSCGPRGGCAAAARALVRLEDALRARDVRAAHAGS